MRKVSVRSSSPKITSSNLILLILLELGAGGCFEAPDAAGIKSQLSSFEPPFRGGVTTKGQVRIGSAKSFFQTTPCVIVNFNAILNSTSTVVALKLSKIEPVMVVLWLETVGKLWILPTEV